MIANKVKLKLGTGSIRIDPVFKAPDYSIVKWATALVAHNARATWRDLANAESYGLFTVDPDGRAYFAPSNAGSFKVNCEVYYRDAVTSVWHTIDQDLTINIEKLDDGNCTCEIKISARAGNVLTMEPDGLYVPTQDNDTIIMPIGWQVEAFMAVYEKDGKLYPLDYRNEQQISKLVGITLKPGQPGELAAVRKGGIIESPQLNLVEGRVYLGAFGRLTQVPTEEHGFLVYLGAAVSNNRLVLNFQDPIKVG